MELSADQLEWIVREVVRRLRQLPTGAGSGELTISDRVITAAMLEERLQGIATLRVDRQAVVTPSAKDLLQDRGVELVRNS